MSRTEREERELRTLQRSLPGHARSDERDGTRETNSEPQRSPFRSAVMTYATNVTAAVLSLTQVMIVARTLGPAGRGDVAFLIAVATLTANFSTWGVEESNANLGGTRPRARQALATNSVLFALMFGAISGLAVLELTHIFPAVGGQVDRIWLIVAMVSLPLLILKVYLQLLVQADYGFGVTNAAWIIGPATTVTLNGAMAATGRLSVGSAIAAWILGQALGTTILVVHVMRTSGFGAPDLPLARESLSFGFRTHLGRFMELGNYRGDQWFVGAISGSRELGFYTVAVAWAEVLYYIPGVLSLVQRPDLVRASREDAARLATRVFRLALVISGVVSAGLIVFAPQLCVTVFGAQFAHSIPDLRVLALSAFGVCASGTPWKCFDRSATSHAFNRGNGHRVRGDRAALRGAHPALRGSRCGHRDERRLHDRRNRGHHDLPSSVADEDARFRTSLERCLLVAEEAHAQRTNQSRARTGCCSELRNVGLMNSVQPEEKWPSRLGVYTDVVYRGEGERRSAAQAFVRFVTMLPPRVDEVVLFGRLDPEPGRSHYELPDRGVRFVALPHYPAVTAIWRQFMAARTSARRFNRELDAIDAVWIFGPGPMSVLFAVIALYRGVPTFLGVRQDYPNYIRHRLPGRAWFWAIPVADALEYAFRRIARNIPTVVVGDALERKYRLAGARYVLSTPFSLVARTDIVKLDVAVNKSWDRELRVLVVGRLAPEKNPLLLAEVAKRLCARDARWRFVVVGDGPMESALVQRALELGVSDAIELKGYVPSGPQLLELYRDSNALLHLSLTEGLPQVIWEAMASGIPIVATDVGGVAAAVGDDLAILIPPNDADAAAAALERLRDDPDERRKQVENGLTKVRDETIEVQLDRIVAFFASSPPHTPPGPTRTRHTRHTRRA